MEAIIKTTAENEKKVPLREELASGYKKAVGEEIRNARQQKRISQKELAKLIDMSAAQLCRIESGDNRPSKATLQKLSGHIGILYPELLRLAGYSNMKGDSMLFNRDGEKIDTLALVSSIYRADSDFLECFHDFEIIGTPENIEVIKALIYAMRKEVEIGDAKMNGGDHTNDFFLNTFMALKRFIVTTFAPSQGTT